jgi:DUF917 family protein
MKTTIYIVKEPREKEKGRIKAIVLTLAEAISIGQSLGKARIYQQKEIKNTYYYQEVYLINDGKVVKLIGSSLWTWL